MPFPLRRWDDDPVAQRRMRKGMYVLPSFFTSMNIAAGYYAISQAIQGSATEPQHFDRAAVFIGIAVIADGLDGRVARMTNTTSEFGKELDSLADVITFGLAPAILAWIWGFRMLPLDLAGDLRRSLIQIGAICTFLFLIAGASRLARFNIQANPQPSNPGRPGKKYFVGMPIPAGAAVIAAVVHFADGRPLTRWWEAATWAGFVVISAFLMVSTWRFPSFKDIHFQRRQSFRLFLLIAAIVAALIFWSGPALFVIAVAYMFSGIAARVSFVLRRRSAPKEASELS